MQLKISDPMKGSIFVFISAFMYATLPILTKLAFQYGLTPSAAIFYRYLFAFILLFLYLKLWKKEPVIAPSLKVILQGLFLVAGSVLFFYALQYIAASIGSIIFFTHPIIVAFLAILIYKENLNLKLAAGLLLALAGIILVSGIFSTSVTITPFGLMLAMISSICYACFALLGQYNVANASPFALTATFTLTGALIVPLVFFRDLHFITSLTWPQVLICLAMALLNTVLSISFYLKGMKLIGATRASLISSLEPVITVILAMLLLNEVLSPLEAAGAVLVLISLYLAMSSQSKDSREQEFRMIAKE